jgi:aconitate hydratase
MYDPFHAYDTFETGAGRAGIYRLSRLEDAGLANISALPFSIRVLLEAVLRNCDGKEILDRDVVNLAGWTATAAANIDVPFKPARVVLQDFTGVPAIVDLAAMRSAMQRLGGDPSRINPLVPVDLVVDHSVQVDSYGSADSYQRNIELEYHRNRERYELLHWGQKAFKNFRVVPPGVGIVHQVNLEYLAKVVFKRSGDTGPVALPDTLLGTDSHTPMINGLGVLGWGVGGIEAEAVMLGQPLYMLAPEVIGFQFINDLPPGTTATDLVLAVTEILRKEGVVGKFVEYFGPGAASMKVAERALLSNMSPEYGATVGFFPVDKQTLVYLAETGRSEAEVELVGRYCKEQLLFRNDNAPPPNYTKVLTLDLNTVEPSLAGPKRPQDRVPLTAMKQSFQHSLHAPIKQRGYALSAEDALRKSPIAGLGKPSAIGHGAVVIAAITSCTNTSNPNVMVAAGLLAKNAVQRGLSVKPYVKTSLAPGSRVVTDYLQRLELDRPLEQLGFYNVGYGCTTCIGNSGPLPQSVADAVTGENLVVASVLSGNRNFEGRIHALVKANYLASPPLVVAYALAGTVDIDLTSEPLGVGKDGKSVYLRDIWPSEAEVDAAVAKSLRPEMFHQRYGKVFDGGPIWDGLSSGATQLYPWNTDSTYIQEPPFLLDMPAQPGSIRPIRGARVLLALGDSVTTDHISPAGNIASASPAGKYLQQIGVSPEDFNSYGSRRGNDRVMTRGTFANIRIRNHLAQGAEGGVTRHLPNGALMSIYDAAMQYKAEGVPLLVLAGVEYGSGSSRDWAAKGAQLLGVKAVLARSYERIHRSNLIGMGVLPLELPEGTSWESLGLTGEETFDLPDLDDRLQVGGHLTVRATDAAGIVEEFQAKVRIDTPIELQYYRHGGILPMVLRKLASQS